MFLGEDDDRGYSEVRQDAIEKIQEADIVEEHEESTELAVDFDWKEAAYIRLELLDPSERVPNGDVGIDMAAGLSLISLSERIEEKMERIDEQTQDALSKEKEEIGFDQLDASEKEEVGQNLSEGEERLRRFFISTELFQDVIVFYMIAGSLIEQYSVELMSERLVDDEFRGSDDAEKWVAEMNQSRRERVLKVTGVLRRVHQRDGAGAGDQEQVGSRPSASTTAGDARRCGRRGTTRDGGSRLTIQGANREWIPNNVATRRPGAGSSARTTHLREPLEGVSCYVVAWRVQRERRHVGTLEGEPRDR